MLYGYGIVIAGFLVGGTVGLAMLINRVREWWEARAADASRPREDARR